MSKIEKITILTPEVAVTSFMTPRSLRIVKTMGFSTVINMMPLSSSVMDDVFEKGLAEKVRKFGLEYRQLPVDSAKDIDQAVIDRFHETMSEVPMPAVIFSRSGQRAITLWALAMRDVLTREQLAEKVGRAGHDISRVITDEQVSGPRAA